MTPIDDVMAGLSLAVNACLALRDAYQQGEERYGSMEWAEVDLAWEVAEQALRKLGYVMPGNLNPEIKP